MLFGKGRGIKSEMGWLFEKRNERSMYESVFCVWILGHLYLFGVCAIYCSLEGRMNKGKNQFLVSEALGRNLGCFLFFCKVLTFCLGALQ